ncbi:hypothetical protein BASA83_006316 [Batrachochytrium salamandrivorans]|nr:hypothetical protein BASA83_006316 [Batrachochytrium salamandrivorans]
MKKVTFEEMLESMSARLHLIEAENESLKMDAQESRAIANRAMLENTVSSNSLPYTKEPRAGKSIPAPVYVASFHQLTADLDWNDSALRAQFYFGLSYEIKDALVHFDTPSTLSLASSKQSKSTSTL